MSTNIFFQFSKAIAAFVFAVFFRLAIGCEAHAQLPPPSWGNTSQNGATLGSVMVGFPSEPVEEVTSLCLKVDYTGTYEPSSLSLDGSWMDQGTGCSANVSVHADQHYLVVTLVRSQQDPVTGDGLVFTIVIGGGQIVNVDHL